METGQTTILTIFGSYVITAMLRSGGAKEMCWKGVVMGWEREKNLVAMLPASFEAW